MTRHLRRTYPELDTMRAFASVAVVGTHTSFWAGTYTTGLVGVATQRLEVGVAIFFVLSGFLLGRPYLQSLQTGEKHDGAIRYFFKRALRILPVYWVCVAAALVLIPDNRKLGLGRWLHNFALTDIYFSESLPRGLTQMWSLSTEVAFYLLLPLLMAFVAKTMCRNRWKPGLVIGALSVLFVLNVVIVSSFENNFSDTGGWVTRGLLHYIGWFALGILIAVLTLDEDEPRLRITAPIIRIARDRASCWTAAIALFVISATPIAGSPLLVAITSEEALARNLLYGLIAFLLVIPCVFTTSTSSMARFMANRFMRHLGHISYGLFCCHVIVLEVIYPHLGYDLFQAPPVLLFALILAISLAVSEALYRLVELPFMKLKSWRSDKAITATIPSDIATQI